jgi:recombination associated protein RdgC
MFKNALIYRIAEGALPALAEIEDKLLADQFAECGATQMESTGWVAPRGRKHGALAESVAGQLVLTLCTETKAVPGSVVKRRLEEQLDALEQQTGRRPKGKQAKELKEAIQHELLPRAFPKRGTTWAWIDPANGLVVVDAASLKKADAVSTRLVELSGGRLQLQLLQTQRSPASAMSEWLASREAPAGFTVDRECELKQPDSEKAAVRYSRHTLEIDEVGEHIRQGKLPTQLALTWEGRVSFVLTEQLVLKKVKLLDVVLEEAEKQSGGSDEGFDTDVALLTGELGRLIADLVDALGGEQVRDAVSGAAVADVPNVSTPSAQAAPPASSSLAQATGDAQGAPASRPAPDTAADVPPWETAGEPA